MPYPGLTFTQLGYLKAAAETPDVTKAALAVGVSLQSLTTGLRAVEKIVGSSILESKPLRLNQAGRAVASVASRVLAFAETAIPAAAAPRDGTLRSPMEDPRLGELLKERSRAPEGWTFEGTEIGLPQPLLDVPAVAAVLELFGLRPRPFMRLGDWVEAESLVLTQGLRMCLRWTCSTADTAAVLVGPDPFGWALIKEDDPLAGAASLRVADLMQRTPMLLDFVGLELLSERPLWEEAAHLADAFGENPELKWVLAPRSFAEEPPAGYRAVALAGFREPRGLYFFCHPKISDRERHDVKALAATLDDVLGLAPLRSAA